MNRQISSTLIGTFIVGAIGLAIISIIIFSKEKIFIEKDRYVAYFEGSVNGLKIGAPVKLKGVQIGIVNDIQVHFDPISKKVLTPTYIDIEPDLVEPINQTSGERYDINTLIDYGLRAQLTLLNVVTGNLYIEVDFLPDTPINLVDADQSYPEIPVVPSRTEQITQVVSDIQELPIIELFHSLLNTVKQIERLVTSHELTESKDSLARTLIRLEHLTAKIENRIDPLSTQSQTVMMELSDLTKTINHQTKSLGVKTDETLLAARKAVDQLRAVLITFDKSIQLTSPLYTEISIMLSEMAAAARSVKVMADTFQQHPEALIYGKHRPIID